VSSSNSCRSVADQRRFILLGSSPRGKGGDGGRHALIFLDFAPLRHKQCGKRDFEKWYARSAEGKECLMGHKVSFFYWPEVRLILGSNGIEGESSMQSAMWVISLMIQSVTKVAAHARRRTMSGMFCTVGGI